MKQELGAVRKDTKQEFGTVGKRVGRLLEAQMKASPQLFTSGALPPTCSASCAAAAHREGTKLAVPPACVPAGLTPAGQEQICSRCGQCSRSLHFRLSRCLCARPLAARVVVERHASCSPFTADYSAFIDVLLKDDAGFRVLLKLVLKRLQVRAICSALLARSEPGATWQAGRQAGRQPDGKAGGQLHAFETAICYSPAVTAVLCAALRGML